jgi:hypothetical protein
MTDLIINRNSFKAEKIEINGRTFDGTVEATIGKETKTVPAFLGNGYIVAHGFVGRYRTGTKLWGATISNQIDPTTGEAWESYNFGFDSRSGRHNRIPDIWFAK